MREYTDLAEMESGDIIVYNGDILDTGDSPMYGLSQTIRTLLRTHKGEWIIFPNFGGDIEEYHGLPNTQSTGYMLARSIKQLIRSNINLYSFEVDVIPFPLGKYTIGFIIKLSILGHEPIAIYFAYNTKTDIINVVNGSILKDPVITIKRTVPPTKNTREQ